MNNNEMKAIFKGTVNANKYAAVILTNPATLVTAVALTGIYTTYKYFDNKDKRKYEYMRETAADNDNK